MLAVGGAKGGVGRTLLASGLAIFLAQLGKKVLLVDGTPRAASLGATFGVARASGSAPPWSPLPYVEAGHETFVPNVRVLETSSELGPHQGRSLRHARDLAAASGCEFCVLDLGPGVSSRVLDPMLDADIPITVTTPEPAAVDCVYRLLRHLYARRLQRELVALGDRAALDALREVLRALGGPPAPAQLAERMARRSSELAAVAWRALDGPRVRLVVNQSRTRGDLDLGEAMARVTWRPMGGALEYLGHVEFDDAVFLSARRRRPLLLDAPNAKASRNLDRITRRLLSAEGTRLAGYVATPAGHVGPPPPPTHYEVLSIDRGASDEEIRRAYRRAREVYASESLALSGLLTGEESSRMVARIEEARDVLLDPSRRRPYDLSITPAEELPPTRATPEAEAEAEASLATANLPPLTPETEYSGALLRLIREARGVDLKDISARTKISMMYLRALEDEDYPMLPAAVYTRGFVTELAKYLRLDVEQVVRTYLRRFRRAQEA